MFTSHPLHKLFLFLLLLHLAPLRATGGINPFGRHMLRFGHESKMVEVRSNDDEYLPVIARLESAETALPDYAHELHRRGDIVLAMVPIEMAAYFTSEQRVSRVETNMESIPVMNHSRTFCNLPFITKPDYGGVPAPAFDGTGTVVGFTDIGFDPNHINFVDTDGTPRVKKLVNYTLDSPYPTILSTPSEIASWQTDDPGEFHATHVGGILAGGYNGDGMQGVATGSDIVATTSPLYDALLLAGCEEIIAYAQQQGKPAVINMSISSETGPHDGTSLFCQYLQQLANDATICISAGNSGMREGYATLTTSADNTSFRTYFRQYPNLSPTELKGQIDVWSSNAGPMQANLLKQDFQTGAIERIPITLNPAEGIDEWVICSADFADAASGMASATMPEGFVGYIYVSAQLNPENNRYNIGISANYRQLTDDPGYLEHRALFGIEVTPPSAGTTIDVYTTSGIYLTCHKERSAGCPAPRTDRNINDFCTGAGAICVGSLDSNNQFVSLGGNHLDFTDLTIGGPSFFSSYGTMPDGNTLPDIVAPGAQIVSSFSSYYCESNPEYTQRILTICREIDGQKYYWGPEQGTSMASPFAAGVAALWLQANPDLNGYEIRDIMTATASPPTISDSSPHWGKGMLDAKAGHDIAIQMHNAGVGSVSAEEAAGNLAIRSYHEYIAVSHPHHQIVRYIITDMAGKTIVSGAPNACDFTVNTQQFASGIYLLSATTTSGKLYTAKTFVR